MFFSTILGFAAAVSAASLPSVPKVLARGDDGAISCDKPSNVDGPIQERENFVEGQEYLRSLGTCVAEANSCSRVSCSNDAGMWLCAGDEKAEVDCGLIADYMDHIFDECQSDGQTYVKAAYGSQENSDGWTVEVGWDYC